VASASAKAPALLRLIGAAPGAISTDRLVGTDDVSPIGDQAFSISPDGKWLLYPSSRGNILAPAYVLYNVEKRQATRISLSAKVQALAAQGRGPLGRAGCWEPDSTRVFLPGDRILFVADPRPAAPRWDVNESVSVTEFRRYYDCKGTLPEPGTIVRTVTVSPREVKIVSATDPGRVFASHRATRADVDRVLIRFPTVASNRRSLSYVVIEYGGSFLIASTGYVLNLTSAAAQKPLLLADHVLGPVLWSPDAVFAYACTSESRGAKAIYRWRMIDEH
jgi:hypothetical protein